MMNIAVILHPFYVLGIGSIQKWTSSNKNQVKKQKNQNKAQEQKGIVEVEGGVVSVHACSHYRGSFSYLYVYVKFKMIQQVQ